MKIAVLTSGRLPVPAVQGGAVENLIDFYLEYNGIHHLHDITVYSIADARIVSPGNEWNHYHYVDISSIPSKIARKIHSRLNKNAYYDSEIEYFLYKALQHIRKQTYDCIILENRPEYAMAVKSVSDARIVLHLHNDLINNETYRAREVSSCLSKVITVSNFIKGRVETLGLDIPVETVYNGIDLKRFCHKGDVVGRDGLGLDEDDFVIVYSGRLTKEKGIKELLEAVSLFGDFPSMKLLVMGSSFYGGDVKHKSPFFIELQQIAEKMPGRVIFTGFVSYDKVPDYLRLADVAVIPSMWDDPFPTTVLEAMSVGLPIIATRSGGIPESCGDCAIIIEKDNVVVDLCNSILSLYNDRLERESMHAKGLQKCSNYGKEQYADKFLGAL